MAARRLGMHPQTLRKYERLGLVQPSRTGSVRLYSEEEIDRLRLIKTMVDEAGINLAGVQRLLDVVSIVQRLRTLIEEDTAREHGRALRSEIDRLYELLGLVEDDLEPGVRRRRR